LRRAGLGLDLLWRGRRRRVLYDSDGGQCLNLLVAAATAGERGHGGNGAKEQKSGAI
jgi:hypothetical protein